VAAKTIYTDNSDYTAADAAGLLAVEPSLGFVDGVPGVGQVGVTTTDLTATTWAADRQSASSDCYYIADDANAGTTYGVAPGTPCTDPAMADALLASW
jgi:hypothetical protein